MSAIAAVAAAEPAAAATVVDHRPALGAWMPAAGWACGPTSQTVVAAVMMMMKMMMMMTGLKTPRTTIAATKTGSHSVAHEMPALGASATDADRRSRLAESETATDHRPRQRLRQECEVDSRRPHRPHHDHGGLRGGACASDHA